MTEAPFLVQDHDDEATWLEARRQHVTASELPVLAGMSRYMSPLELWALKTGRLEPEGETLRLKLGRALEPMIADEFALGLEEDQALLDPGDYALHVSTENPLLACTPDRLIVLADDPHAVVGGMEAKTWATRWEDGVPPQVWLQAQTQALVLGVPEVKIAVLFLLEGRLETQHTVTANDHAQDYIAELATRFWHHVQRDEPPPASGDARRVLRLLYPKPAAIRVSLPASWASTRERLKDLRREIGKLAEEKAALEAGVMEAMKDAEEAVIEGTSDGWTWKLQKREAYEVAAAEYRTLREKTWKEKKR